MTAEATDAAGAPHRGPGTLPVMVATEAETDPDAGPADLPRRFDLAFDRR
jgi:hypothetical protein